MGAHDIVPAAWWSSIEPLLLADAGRLVGHDLARDLTQDVAIIALARRVPFGDEGHFRAWARVKVRYLALDALTARRDGVGHLASRTEPAHDPPTQERVAMLRELVARLPPQQRGVIEGLLRGHSSHDIAAKLQISAATVRSLKRHAMSAMAGDTQVVGK